MGNIKDQGHFGGQQRSIQIGTFLWCDGGE